MIYIKIVSSKSKYDTRTSPSKSKAKTKSVKKKKNRSGAAVLALALIVLVGVGGLIVYMGMTAKNSEVVYPNVYAIGINFGGKTLEEASQTLLDAEYNKYADASVTVVFPDDITLEVTAAEAGLVADTQSAAANIYNYGRNGSFIENAVSYFLCTLKKTDIETMSDNKRINEAYLRAQIAQTAKQVNAELLHSSLIIGADEITITKGTSGVLVDEDAVYKLITDAFLSGAYGRIDYTPGTESPTEIDLRDIYGIVYKEPVNAEYDEKFNVIPGEDGISFDIEAAQPLIDSAKFGEVVRIPLVQTPPEVTAEELESRLFRDLLAGKTTEMTNITSRSKNIELAANAVSGTVLMPGEVFSYNGVVGQRTAEKGYGYAAAYMNGEVVQEIGGGVCQVSSTIYYACLYADLEIVYRTCHLYIASYVPFGMDATVSWPGPDFKFKNNTEYPLKIVTYREGQTITCELWGTRTDFSYSYIEMEYTEWKWIEPEVTYKEDPSIAPGTTKLDDSGHWGLNCSTYKCKYDENDNLISRVWVADSYYSNSDKIYLCAVGELYNYLTPEQIAEYEAVHGKPSPSPSPSPEPSPDISPEPSPDTSPEPSPDISPEPSPDTSPETSPDTSPEPSPDASSEPSPDPSAETSPEP